MGTGVVAQPMESRRATEPTVFSLRLLPTIFAPRDAISGVVSDKQNELQVGESHERCLAPRFGALQAAGRSPPLGIKRNYRKAEAHGQATATTWDH